MHTCSLCVLNVYSCSIVPSAQSWSKFHVILLSTMLCFKTEKKRLSVCRYMTSMFWLCYHGGWLSFYGAENVIENMHWLYGVVSYIYIGRQLLDVMYEIHSHMVVQALPFSNAWEIDSWYGLMIDRIYESTILFMFINRMHWGFHIASHNFWFCITLSFDIAISSFIHSKWGAGSVTTMIHMRCC